MATSDPPVPAALDALRDQLRIALRAAHRELVMTYGYQTPRVQPLLLQIEDAIAASNDVAALRAAGPRHREFATKLFNIVLGDLEWVRAQGGRHSVCPLCHCVCERDGGPGHADDCPRIEIAQEFNALYPPTPGAAGPRRTPDEVS